MVPAQQTQDDGGPTLTLLIQRLVYGALSVVGQRHIGLRLQH